MYRNYGDRDFFEHGVLVDTEHSDTCFPMLLCRPYPDAEDLYQFGEVEVDLNDFKDDGWGDRKAIMDFLGMTEETYDPVRFAIGCTEYHSWDNFGAISYAYDWQHMDKKSICEILKCREIASDHLDIVW